MPGGHKGQWESKGDKSLRLSAFLSCAIVIATFILHLFKSHPEPVRASDTAAFYKYPYF